MNEHLYLLSDCQDSLVNNHNEPEGKAKEREEKERRDQRDEQ